MQVSEYFDVFDTFDMPFVIIDGFEGPKNFGAVWAGGWIFVCDGCDI